MLVKDEYVTFVKFDPVRYDVLDDRGDNEGKGYSVINNWVLIGSLGDPETWKGLAATVSMKKGAKDGLAGTLIDMNVMQEILYKRPSGYLWEIDNGWYFTHRLQSVLLADSNSVIKRETILA